MKPKLILSILLIVLILSGCAKDGGGQTSEPPEQSVTYPETDVSGTNVLFVKTSNGFAPIALAVDGRSQLSGENYYYNIQSVVSGDSALRAKPMTYFADDGRNLGSVTYGELESDAKKAEPYKNLITSGNWQLSPSIRHEQYGAKDTVGDGYKQFIFESFPDKFASVSDIKVTDIWEYDMDGDGSNDAVIRATGDGYTVLVLQSPGLGSVILAADMDGSKGYTAQPFFADFDGDGGFSLIVISGSGFRTAQIYKQGTANIDYMVYLPLEK